MVTADGIGLSHEQIQTLFQPFSLGGQHVAHQYGGADLGLVVSQRLASMLDATLSVESTPDQSSTFRIELPRVLCETRAAGQISSPGAVLVQHTI